MTSNPANSNAPVPATVPLPASPARLVAFAVLALGGGLSLAAWLSRASYESHTGYLQARGRTVVAGRAARVQSILVQQGEVVPPGTPLFVLSDVELEDAVARKQREIAALEAELAQAQARASVELAARTQALEAEIFDTRLKFANYLSPHLAFRSKPEFQTFAQRDDVFPPVTIVPLSLEEQRLPVAIPPGGTTSPSGVAAPEESSHERDLAAARVELCRERLAQLQERLDRLPENIREAMGVNVAEARLAMARDELARLEQRQKSLVITADVYGTVGVFLKQVGELVSADEPVVELLDEDQPYLLVQIPSDSLADFAPGTVLELRFPDGSAREGKVAVIPPQVAPLSRANERMPDEALISVIVAPSGRLWPSLPFGTTVEVRRPKRDG